MITEETPALVLDKRVIFFSYCFFFLAYFQGLGSEVPASPVIPVAQSTFFAKPSVKVLTAAESVRTPSLTSSSSSNATNIPATSRSDSGLNHIAQKSVLQQSPLHEKPNAVSHPQQTSTAAPTTTAVTFTVNPRPAQLTMHQGGSKAPEKETRNLQTISAQPVLPKAHQQPQTVEQIKSSPGITSQIQLSSQANSALDRIRQHQEKLLQQRQVLQQQHKQQQQQQHEQQQQRFPRASTPTVQQQKHPAETTASLLQQLQRQQQFQQQQHYQRMAVQQQKPQERHLSAPSSQIRQQQVSALAPRQPDPSIPQNQQIHQQSVRPSSGQLSNSQERNCSSIPSQNPVYTLEQLRQSRSQQNAASNPLPSLLSSSARNPNNILKPDEASVVNSAGKNSTSPKLITLSNLSNQRAHLVNSNTLVHEHINKLANNSRSSQMSSSVQVRNSGQHGETLHRQETASAVNVAANGTYSRESTEYQHAQHRQQPGATQNHKTTATGREGSHIPRDVLAAAASTYKQIQPDAHPGILVPARKKHIEEEVLPSGYRFSVPSPEYLIQRQRIQQQQQQQQRDQPQHPQASHVSQNQSLQRKTHPERVSLSGGQRRDPSGLVYMREHPTREMPIIQLQTAQKETVLNQTSQNEAVPPPGYRPIRSSLENWSQQQNHHEHRRQQHQSQPTHASQDLQSLQGQQEVTNEGGNHPITQLSIYRPPIQSPGISSSDPPNEKHPRDAQKTTHPATANQPSNTNLIVLNQGNTLPKPSASIAVMDSGIVLSWNMEYDDASIKIDNYELFACQDVTETNGQPIKWKKIGIVKALPLPMACTLTQFSSGSKYFFSVRAVDGKERAGPFSDPCTVSLNSS